MATVDVAIVERATDELAGEVVLLDRDTSARSCSFRIPLRGPAWFGRGLGTEAITLLIRHGFQQLDLQRITLEVLSRNPRARRAYEKAGFVVTNETTEDGEDWTHMAITPPAQGW